MNRKAQIEGIGVFIAMFVAIIVGLAIYTGAITGNIGAVTNLRSFNTSAGQDQISAASVLSASISPTTVVEISTDAKAIEDDFLVLNATNGAVVSSGNYTVTDNYLLNGILTAVINTNASTPAARGPWNVSYTYQGKGYIPDAGGRTIAGLIALFAVLAIAVVALVPTLRSKILEMRF